MANRIVIKMENHVNLNIEKKSKMNEYETYHRQLQIQS